MKAFEFINAKYDRGLTVVLDKGLPLRYFEDYLNLCGDYIDYIKFGWGTIATIDREIIKEKIRLSKEFNIKAYPGGTLFEYCYINNKFEDYLNECKDLGFETLEISDGSINLSLEERKDIIEKVGEEFEVLTEVGKKDPSKDRVLSVDERIRIIKEDLNAGAKYVIIEGRESGKNIGLYDKNGNVKEDELNLIVKNVDIKNLIFEAPLKSQQVSFIKKFGSSVNLGNIPYEDVISLETLRRGLRGDTFNILNQNQ
ncbi:phosphosulfolactate synthase [Methanocaldococcus infernus]